jgi:hypothetical protein
MTEKTYKPTFMPETSLLDLERDLSVDFISVQDMDLNYWLDLTPLNNISGSIGKRKKYLGLWSRFERMIETNDLVTELERIKVKREIVFQLKIVVCGERKTHEATPSNDGDEFKVHLEETQSSKWRKSRAPHDEF